MLLSLQFVIQTTVVLSIISDTVFMQKFAQNSAQRLAPQEFGLNVTTHLSARSISYKPHQYVIYPQTLPYYNSQASQSSNSRCYQPQQIGNGPYRIPRWSYNPASSKCELFYWSGCCGNGNNFQTLQNCKKTCEEPNNPCAFGSTTPQIQCSIQSITVCAPQQFCHIGAAPATTVCCNKPSSGDRCTQPLSVGIGNANLQRWYFNTANQQCQPCIYNGLQGNENNFLNQQACESACFVNPCTIGTPYRNQGVLVQCAPTNQIICPAAHYCHVGASPQTSVCCQALGGDPCGQAMDRGEGGAQLQRWYWNTVNQQCLPFIYSGRKGTQNNFLNQQECERTCIANINPCAQGEPQKGLDNQFLFCNIGQNNCAPTFWCHVGADKQTTVCCPGRVGERETCSLPLITGSGQANLQRWHFDGLTRKCTPFIYKGIFGNQNNFLSQQECEQICPGFLNPCSLPLTAPPVHCSFGSQICGQDSYCHIGFDERTTICCPSEGNPCILPLATGTGSGALQRFYFNQQTDACQPFTYGGLKGNQNNFLNKEVCEETCAPNPCLEGTPLLTPGRERQRCNSGTGSCIGNYWCHIGANVLTTVCCPRASLNPCALPLLTGDGNSNLERFYYDATTRSCRPFFYRGLKGNQNNFLTLRRCQLQCEPVVNPCSGQPATTEAGQVLFCSPTNKDTCPVNFWCHVGASPETTVCCPGATNPCSVPLAPGTGNAGLSRWYYNADDRTCLPFQYNGMRGNQNNFESRAECSRICPAQLCLLSIDAGACGGRQTRFAFNRQANQCVSFEYTGCGGNLNNFLTMDDCMATCGRITF